MVQAADFAKTLQLTVLSPSTQTEWDIRTTDLNRPGMQFCGFTCGCALRGTLRTGFVALIFCSAEQNQQGHGPCASKLTTQGKWGDERGMSSL